MNALRITILKTLDATLGSLLCRWARRSRRMRANVAAIPSDPKAILVIRPGGLGDLILLLPVLRRLVALYPRARIDLVCEKRNQEMIPLSGLPVRPLAYDTSPVSFLRGLLRTSYDLAIDSEQFHHFSALFAVASGAPVRIGFNINPVRFPLYTHGVSYETNGFEGTQFMRLLEPLEEVSASGKQDASSSEPKAPAKPDPANEAPAPFVLLHPGATSRHKQWAPDRFVELALRLLESTELDVAVLADPRRNRASARVRRALDKIRAPRLRILPAQSLRETAELIRRSQVLVGSDSGLIHLAVWLGTPSVALFGPGDPDKWSQPHPRHQVVRHPLPCAPCALFGRHTPCRAIDCMQAITVEEVLSAVAKALCKS